MSKFSEQERVVIRRTPEVQSYAGRYSGTDAVVQKVDTDFTVTIMTYDNKTYIFPVSYLCKYDDYYAGADWLPPVPESDSCDCGEKYMKNSTGIHLDFCRLYKESV